MSSIRLRAIAALLCLPAMAVISLAGCGKTDGPIDHDRSDRLDQALQKLLDDPEWPPHTDTRLRDLTDFGWDAVYAFDGEGTAGRTIRARTGQKLIDDDERFWQRGDLLIFTNGSKPPVVLSISYMFAYNDGDKYSRNVLIAPTDGGIRLDLKEPGKAG